MLSHSVRGHANNKKLIAASCTNGADSIGGNRKAGGQPHEWQQIQSLSKLVVLMVSCHSRPPNMSQRAESLVLPGSMILPT